VTQITHGVILLTFLCLRRFIPQMAGRPSMRSRMPHPLGSFILKWAGSDNLKRGLPDFQPEIPVLADQLEVDPVGCNQQRSVRPRCERDQHVEVQIA